MTLRRARHGGVALLVAATLSHGFVPSALAAEPSPSELLAARDLFTQAVADEKRGDHASALEKLRRVATVKATPSVRFHLAYCAEHLGQLVVALGEYDAAERDAQRENNVEVLKLVRTALPALRARVPTLALSVDPRPPGLVVRLDGAALADGVLGVPVPIDPGSHVVDVEAPGYLAQTVRIELGERETGTRLVQLERESVRPASAPRGATSSADGLTPPPPAADGGPSLALPLATSAGALVLAGGGVGLFFAAGARAESAARECGERVVCDDLRGDVRTLDALALGAFVGAAGLAVLSVVLFARSPEPPAARASRTGLFVGPGGLEGRFR